MSLSTSLDNRDLTNDELGCLRDQIELYQRLGFTRPIWMTIACKLRLPYLSVKRMGDEMVQSGTGSSVYPSWNPSMCEQGVAYEFDESHGLNTEWMESDSGLERPRKICRTDNEVPDPAIGTGDVPAMMGRRCSSWKWELNHTP
jgi:hypothetical protein